VPLLPKAVSAPILGAIREVGLKASHLMFVAAVGLAGCATPEQLMQKSPMVSLQVSASPEDVRDCFTSPHPGLLAVTPMKDGWIVMHQIMGFAGPEATAWIAQIERTPAGSRLTIHKDSTYGIIYRDEAQPCVDKFARR